VSQLQLRLLEAAKMGFTRCIVPAGSRRRIEAPKGITIQAVRQVAEAMEVLF
jgi:DNA repair protein RadA/Sms